MTWWNALHQNSCEAYGEISMITSWVPLNHAWLITSLNIQTAGGCGYTLSQKEYENISLYNEKN